MMLNTIQQMKAYLFCVYELLLNILDNLITFKLIQILKIMCKLQKLSKSKNCYL